MTIHLLRNTLEVFRFCQLTNICNLHKCSDNIPMVFRQSAICLSQKSKSKTTAWASRQLRDPYVKQRVADAAAYRARSAFKLLEINEEWSRFLEEPDVRAVVDLGAAPGGWSQVVADKLGWSVASLRSLGKAANVQEEVGVEEEQEAYGGDDWKPKKKKKRMGGHKVVPEPLAHFDPLNIDDVDGTLSPVRGRGTIVAVDLLPIEPIHGVQTIKADFMQDATTRRIRELLVSNPENPRGNADVILSDMAANVSGNVVHDIEASLEICEAVFDFASKNLRSAQSVGRRKGGVLL